jgi:dTDP-4-amino-4,6-dideoxygalactose transaminase
MEIAEKYNLKVIEDNAQGIGCTWDGKMSCSFVMWELYLSFQ